MSATALRIVEGSSMDKSKALSAALSQIERQFGKGSVMKLGKNDRSMDVETVSSGSLGLDIALGVGGLPKGRGGRDLWAGILRQDHAGAATRWRKARRRAASAPSSTPNHALDPVYARKLGVNIDELLISQPDTGEQALGNLRHPGALRRGRCAGDRFGGGAGAEGRTRRRDGRCAPGPAGAVDEPGVAQAHRLDQQVQYDGDLHQPDSG